MVEKGLLEVLEGFESEWRYARLVVGCVLVVVLAVAARISSWARREKPNKYQVALMRGVRMEKHVSAVKEAIEPCSSESSARDRAVIRCVNPATGDVLAVVENMGKEAVSVRVEKARVAQKKWSTTSFSERRRVLRLVQQFVLENQREICEISCIDTGKTMLDASLGEILTSLEKLRWLIAEGEAALLPERRSTGPLTAHRIASVEFHPLGVIAAISPWNYPFHNLLNPLSASLFAGSALVVKPSEHSSFSTACFVSALRAVLAATGADPELLQLVTGDGAAGAAVVQNAAVDKVFFTGSTRVGQAVAAQAAQRLVPVVLELGGKDAFVVFEDADLGMALPHAMRGVFQNAGQNCIGIERLLLQDTIFERAVLQFEREIRGLRVREDVGAMTMGEPELHRLEALVEDAVQKGARLVCGGHRVRAERQDAEHGSFFQPTLLVDVDTSMRISQEEVFGPIMSVFKFATESEAVEITNGSPFGLNLSILTSDASRAQRMLAATRTGMCNINDFAVNYLCQSLPFGGTKMSGSDRFAGIEGLRGCCLIKSVTRDRFPWPLRTSLPAVMRYPVSPNGYAFSHALNETVYGGGGSSPWTRLTAVADLLSILASPTSSSDSASCENSASKQHAE
mmetsp:Transcript_16380/g.35590  ORF Transcript_16380/g.35590 Transcript_16380/m.35590 type:complete len:627 (-) Transcript_16380:317-2197(-)